MWDALVQRALGRPVDDTTVHAAASQGVATPASALPFADTIQRAFGRHDVSSVHAHTGPDAASSAHAMGADAYATGNHVVLGRGTNLHTVAHEAAHVVQQRGGVQLKGGIGAAGDTYERHADAVADRVVAGHSAEDLLDRGATGATPVVQRKETKDDAQLLENQASLKNTDVEIPALEGALLGTRKRALALGLLSQRSFNAGLALSQAMTQLQPAVAATGPVDKALQESAAVAAQQLFSALQAETADDNHFKPQPSTGGTTAITSQNPYTEEVHLTTGFLFWATTHDLGSWFQKLPALIRQGAWEEAFRGYRRMLDGLDLWVADQLRKKGKGTPEEALGNAQQHHAQLRTGLEQISGKHAQRLPALFHPDAKTVEKEKAAGRPAADTIPMNVYFWKDDADGKVHLYDLTTPGRPHEQAIDGPPTAAAMTTFFEEIARYPEGEVRYTLPGGAAGVAPTTGKTKWYEWIGYAGLATAGVGLALLTAGASIPATVCFAAGAVAGGISATGHLVDTARLGTATTTTVVLDVAQIVASFASVGAMGITVKLGGASAAVSSSRWFVPVVGTAAGADVIQLVALTDLTLADLSKIQSGAGSAEDKQRAMAVMFTQLIVVGGLTALSVQGARNLRGLAGTPLEVVEQSGAKILRVAGEDAPAAAKPAPALEAAPVPASPETHTTTASEVKPATSAEAKPPDTTPDKARDTGSTEPIKSELPAVGEQHTTSQLPRDAQAQAGADARAEALAKDRADLRWQMNDKNRRLVKDGEPARYTDLDSDVNMGMDNAAIARERGYPYGFKNKDQFKAMAEKLKADIGGLPAPPGGIAIPTNEIVVQGSAVHRPTAADIDIAVMLSPEDFGKLIEQSFSKECARVRARGADPLTLTVATAGNAAERTLGRAVESGKINRNAAVPSLSDARNAASTAASIKVDLSIIKKGGPFDHGPYIPLP